MDSKMQWFKFYGQDWLTDLKIITMEPLDRLIYVYLMCYGSVSDFPGTIRRCKEDALLKMFHLYHIPESHGCLTRFEMYGLVKVTKSNEDGYLEIDLVNFRKRQERALTPSERQALYRDRRKEDSNEDVTESNGDVTRSNGSNETVTLEKRRIEKNREEKNRENTGTKFHPPTLEEVEAYCKERGNKIKPSRFIDYYQANGWMVGKNKMKDWKAAIRNWEQKDTPNVEPKIYQPKKK